MYIDTAFPCTYLLYLLLIFFQFRHIILYITCDRPYIYRMGTTPVFFLYTFVLRRRIIYTIVSAKSISLSLGSLLLLLQRPTKVQRFQKIIQYALGNIHRNIYLSIRHIIPVFSQLLGAYQRHHRLIINKSTTKSFRFSYFLTDSPLLCSLYIIHQFSSFIFFFFSLQPSAAVSRSRRSSEI